MVSADSAPPGASPDTNSSTAAAVSPDAEETVISWEGATYARSRSVVVGCLIAVLAGLAVVVAVGVTGIVLSGLLTAEAILVGGVLLLVGGPISLLYVAIAYSESTESDKQAFRRSLVPFTDDLAWLRPRWVGGGVLGTVAVGWWLSGITSSFGSLVLVVVAFSPLVFSIGRSHYRLEPASDVLQIRLSYGEHTHERSLAWLVGVRRLRVGSVSLFVCSNRGKRWYEGVNLLVVPQPVDEQVDEILREIATSDSPRRVKRDERILFAIIGASMVGVGPFLYFLSSEPALLFILAGPSTLIGLGVVVHALRG